MMPFTAATLFSGIGGADLGIQRAGFELIWQCERDRYRQAILARHFPDVWCYPDAATLPDHAGVRSPDLLFIDPPTRTPRDFEVVWPILARLHPPMLAIHATSEGFEVYRARMTALGYAGMVFGLNQEITRLEFTITKMQPFLLAWVTEDDDAQRRAAIQAALPPKVGEYESTGAGVMPRSVVEIVELLTGFPLRWSCECQWPVAVACRETSARLVALNQATDPALAQVIATAARRLLESMSAVPA
jgi:hypothetical protein